MVHWCPRPSNPFVLLWSPRPWNNGPIYRAAHACEIVLIYRGAITRSHILGSRLQSVLLADQREPRKWWRGTKLSDRGRRGGNWGRAGARGARVNEAETPRIRRGERGTRAGRERDFEFILTRGVPAAITHLSPSATTLCRSNSGTLICAIEM